MPSEFEEDVLLIVELSDDEKEITLVYNAPSGRKVTMEEFLLDVEQYAKETLRAAGLVMESGTIIH